MLAEIAARVSRGESFAFETTLSGLNYARHIPKWRKAGYQVKLIFLSLPTPELAVARVKARAAQGGHDVAEAVIQRRFDAGLLNFTNLHKRLAHTWILYDNSGALPIIMKSGDNP